MPTTSRQRRYRAREKGGGPARRRLKERWEFHGLFTPYARSSHSIQLMWMHVRSMNGGMTACAPAIAEADVGGMIDVADENRAQPGCRIGPEAAHVSSMAFQTQ